MRSSITAHTKRELVIALRARYAASSRVDKARIPDEFTAISGYHRKSATPILNGSLDLPEGARRRARPRMYDEAVRQALIVLREASDRICRKPNAKAETILEYKIMGVERTKAFGAAEHKAARILLCTHDAWLAELRGEDGRTRHIYHWTDGPHELVIVDEEPKNACVYAFSPTDVTRLKEILGTAMLNDEARAYGFTEMHLAATTLTAIRDRMEPCTDKTTEDRAIIAPVQELVSSEERDILEEIKDGELYRRIVRVTNTSDREADEVRAQCETVLKGLRAASEGRVFYSRGGMEGTDGGTFLAYYWGVRIPARIICLDGTVDLDRIQAASRRIFLPEGVRPSYAGSELHLIDLPSSVTQATPTKGKHYLDRDYVEAQAWTWIKDFVLKVTTPGEKVLVYMKKALRRLSFEGTKDHKHAVWGGREVHFHQLRCWERDQRPPGLYRLYFRSVSYTSPEDSMWPGWALRLVRPCPRST